MFGKRPRDKRRAWSQLRQPHIEEVAARIIRFTHAARRPPNRPDAQAFFRLAWCPESYNTNRHGIGLLRCHTGMIILRLAWLAPCPAKGASRYSASRRCDL